jgi:hypothetical protein
MIAIGVIDVGSPARDRLWWATEPPPPPGPKFNDLDDFIEVMAAFAEQGPIAIGFEAPMFIPLRDRARDLFMARKGETEVGSATAKGWSRPWSGGAGATIATGNLAIMAYTLGALRVREPRLVARVDWKRPLVGPFEVLFFEAFVSNKIGKDAGWQKGDPSELNPHYRDALQAVEAARAMLVGGEPARSAIEEDRVLSMLGTVLMLQGWSVGPEILRTPCLVVRPDFQVAAG